MNNKNSAVLFITLVILSIVIIMGAGVCTMIGRDIYTIKRLRASTQAYFLTEAGIEESIRDLYDNGFNFGNFPKNNNLGNGSFTAVLDTSRYSSEKIVKITSTGAVGDVTRTLSAVVKDRRIEAFTYAVLSGGKMWIAGDSVVNQNVHSNSPSQSWLSPALVVGGILFTNGTVNGNATASGTAVCTWLGTVGGTLASNRPSVSMPPFDAAFWDYYYQLANQSGNVYNGTRTFSGNVAPANGVIWVNGNALIAGDCTLTGCIITTGNIRVLARLTHTPKSGSPYSNFPALMSKNSYIAIWRPTVLNGFVYAGSYITLLSIDSIWGQEGIDINSAINCSGRLDMFFTDLDYTEPVLPGLSTPPPLEVIYWGQ